MRQKTARFSLACILAAALVLSACSSSASDPTTADSAGDASVESTTAVSNAEESVVAEDSAAVESTVAESPVTTIGPLTKYTLASLVNGDRACYVELTFPGGGATLLGDFELCPGGTKDASALIGKEVKYVTEKSNVQAASCEGSDSCTDTEEVDLVVSVTDAALSQPVVVQ